MNIQEIRSQYPQYDDLSDEDLASRFHKKFYSDMDRGDFDQRIGLTPKAYSGWESAGMGALHEGTFGFADEIAALPALFTDEDFSEARKRQEGYFEQAQRDNPGAYLAGQVGGAIGTGFIPGAAGVRLARGGSKLAQGAAAGLVGGTLSGAGHGEGLEGRARGALLGGATGAGVGGIAGKVLGGRGTETVRQGARETTEALYKSQGGKITSQPIFESLKKSKDTLSRLDTPITEISAKKVFKQVKGIEKLLKSQKEWSPGSAHELRQMISNIKTKKPQEKKAIATILDDLDNTIFNNPQFGFGVVRGGVQEATEEFAKRGQAIRSTGVKNLSDEMEVAYREAIETPGKQGSTKTLQANFKKLHDKYKDRKNIPDDVKQAIKNVAYGGNVRAAFQRLVDLVPMRGLGGVGSAAAVSAFPTLGYAVPAALAARGITRGMTRRAARKARESVGTEVTRKFGRRPGRIGTTAGVLSGSAWGD